MLKARINKSKVVSFFDTGGVVVSVGLLTASVLDEAGATAHTLTFSQSAVTPDLYVSSSFVPLKAEHYRVVFKYNGTAIRTDYLDVGSHPVPDFPLHIAQDLLVGDNIIPDGEVVTVKVCGSDMALDATLSATFDAALAAYKAAHTFTAADDYFVVWYKEIAAVPTPVAAYAYYVNEPTDKQTVRLTAGYQSGSTSVPYASATIVLTDSSGLQAAKVVTDAQGSCVARVDPGVYTASLIKAGYVFTTNNFSLTVVDTDTDTGNNTFQLISTSIVPTVSDPAPPASLCTLTIQLFRVNGEPFRGAEISVTPLHKPSLISGSGVVDTRKVYTLDANGYLEFDLVQGAVVEVAISAVSLRRTLTVPSDAGPYNILTMMTAADDPFDIITPSVAAAPSRTL